MKPYHTIALFALFALFFLIFTSTIYPASGIVKFINHSHETFQLTNSDTQKAAKLIGLPLILQSNNDHNYRITLSAKNVGEHFEYVSKNKNLHFSISVNATDDYIYHHTTKKTVEYLSVDWKNILQHGDVHFVLPLFWNNAAYKTGQPVRVDADNNALIGIFQNRPKNAITIMSYNTDKDGSGTDHNPKYRNIQDILGLFLSDRLPTPDILMIQEGLGAKDINTYKQALSELTPGNWFDTYATEGGRPDSNIILVSPKYNGKNIHAGKIVFKSQCGWGLIGKRNAAYVDIPLTDILQKKIPGDFRIFDTHLESGKYPDIFFHAAKIRFSQFTEILHYPRTNVSALVIGGDFNTFPIFDAATGLTKYQFGDLTSVFDKYLGKTSVNWGKPITCTWSTCAKYTLNVGMWTDRMLSTKLSTPGYKTYVLYPFVAHAVDGYSDHLPIWFTLYFEKNASYAD